MSRKTRKATYQVSCPLSLPLLNISNCQSLSKYPSLHVYRANCLHLYDRYVSKLNFVSYLFANLVVLWLYYYCFFRDTSGTGELVPATCCQGATTDNYASYINSATCTASATTPSNYYVTVNCHKSGESISILPQVQHNMCQVNFARL